MLSVTFCGAVVLKVVDQKTLVKRRRSYKVRIKKLFLRVNFFLKEIENGSKTANTIFFKISRSFRPFSKCFDFFSKDL